jgi:hypothetical protein
MPETPNQRRLRELEEIARQVKRVWKDLKKEIEELRREIRGEEPCPQA